MNLRMHARTTDWSETLQPRILQLLGAKLIGGEILSAVRTESATSRMIVTVKRQFTNRETSS
jgi:hypothetical protein